MISKNIEFLRDNKVIFICGCNLVIYDLTNRNTHYILRRYPEYLITSLSVGYRSETEGYVCIGEYNNQNFKSQISVINLFDHSKQYLLCTKDQKNFEWKIFNTKIMKNHSYVIALAKKENSNMNNFSMINLNQSSNFQKINRLNTLNNSVNLQNMNKNNMSTNYNLNNSTILSSTNLNQNSFQNHQTKFSFWKYSQELFISEAILDEDIYDCAYNPKNSHELILCGKGYMRLWNVFINEGSLKEHPQRYLKNKQEKEHTFIKAEFFENKSFMFAVGTIENIIYIVEGFNVLCEINGNYKKENIIDLNVNGINNLTEEDETDIENPNATDKKSQAWGKQGINPISDNNKINQNITGSISFSTAKRNSSMLDENGGLNNTNYNPAKSNKDTQSKSFFNLNNNKEKDNLNLQTENSGFNINMEKNISNNIVKEKILKNTSIIENRGWEGKNLYESMSMKHGNLCDNSLRSFNLIGNGLILFTFKNDSITYIYNLDKELKRKKDLSGSINNFNATSLEEISKENKEKEEILVNRISKNIKQIINITANEDHSKLIYTVEVYTRPYQSIINPKKQGLSTNYQSETQISLFLFNRKNAKISFEREIFNNFFHKYQTIGFALCEKNQMFYTLNDNKTLRCFDYKNNVFLMQNKLKEQPIFITSCPNNNLIGMSFSNKFSIYFQLRDKVLLFSEFDVTSSQAKFSEKGDYIAIYGENNYSKMYNIYFVDTLYLNTVHIIENFKYKVKKLCWVDNDRYLFALFENNNIFGWNINMDFLTVNLQQRFKDREIDLESTYFRMVFKHFVKGNEYEDFEYDFKNDYIILAHKNIEKVKIYI